MSLRFTDSQDSVAPEQDYVDIGLFCADVCRTLDRGLSGRHLNELSRPVRGAIEELTTLVQLAACTMSNTLTKVSIAGQWPTCRGNLSRRVNETRFLVVSTRRWINARSPLGGRTLTGSFRSSTYVQPGTFDDC